LARKKLNCVGCLDDRSYMPNKRQTKYNLLLVDDDIEARSSLKEIILSEFSLNIIECQNGQEAWDLFQKKTIHMIVSDFRMPLVNGTELLKKIKKEYPDLPFALVSAHPDKDLYRQGLRANVTEILEKPVLESDLYRTIRLMMEMVDNDQLLEEHAVKKKVIPPQVFEKYLKKKREICQNRIIEESNGHEIKKRA
jgi:two-component system response regulator YesN